ncbi:MAG: hypothetical protein KGZ32_05610 [Dethiobacter sp.]|jgi:polyhydroxyalkanoate synthesis regulator phasin|nr:hypothetical protein [Dethiobacter sp.]
MILDDIFSASLGLLIHSKEKAEQFIDFLVEKGDMQRDEAGKLVSRLMEKGKEEKGRYQDQFHKKFETVIRDNLITKEDFNRLEAKLDNIIALLQNRQ